MGYPNHTGFQSHGAISVPVRPPILSFLVVVVGLCVPCLMVISTSLFSTVLVGRLAKNCAKCILATTKIGPFSVAQSPWRRRGGHGGGSGSNPQRDLLAKILSSFSYEYHPNVNTGIIHRVKFCRTRYPFLILQQGS